MKHLPASLLAILLAASAPLGLVAAEPAAKEPESAFGLAPAQPDVPVKSDTLLPEGQGTLPLIPESMPPLDNRPSTGKSSGNKSEPAQKEEKKSVTSAAEDALRDLVKLRAAKTKAQNDPAMLALWDTTYTAKTDYEQRAIMTKYYNSLCERIAKIDKSLDKDVIDSLREHYLSKYDQNRIAPTLPPDGSVPVATLVKEGADQSGTKDKKKKHKKH